MIIIIIIIIIIMTIIIIIIIIMIIRATIITKCDRTLLFYYPTYTKSNLLSFETF